MSFSAFEYNLIQIIQQNILIGSTIQSTIRRRSIASQRGKICKTLLATCTYDTEWPDLLTAYNGTAITYDAIGNPLNDGTWTYTWQHGRQLASMSKSGSSITYGYNADGKRISKTVDGTTYNYAYLGDQLTEMTWGSSKLHFTYDAMGPASVTYNGNRYFYLKNAQGDVTGLVDGNGTQVVSYTYDPWGAPMAVSGTMASTLGAVNPLRYRGYVYDTETGLYYLSSRYYNPTWGRFVNADGYASTGQGFTGDNMFAYCNDNPVGYSDQNGEFSIVVGPAVALGTVVGLTSGIGMLIYAKRSDGNAVAGFFSGFIGGFFSGFTSVQLLTAGICNPQIMGLLRPISTAITSIAYEVFATGTLKSIDWELLLLDMSIDMLVSLMYPSIAQLEGESQIILTSGYDIAVDIVQTELLYPNLPKQAPNNKLRNHKSVYRGGQSSGYGRRIGGVIPSVY